MGLEVNGLPATAEQKAAIRDELVPLAELSPVVLTGSTALARASHANRKLLINSPSATNQDLPASATEGDRFFGVNLGSGAVTLRLNGGGAVPGNAILPATVDQWSPFEVWFVNGGFVRVA